ALALADDARDGLLVGHEVVAPRLAHGLSLAPVLASAREARMPVRITRVYTRTGDKGETALVGGRRVPKDSPRIEAYGTIDELNAVSELATPADAVYEGMFRVGAEQVTALERLMDECQKELTPLKSFILPGGGPVGGFLHQARTVCRRAERRVLELARVEDIGEWPL